MKACRSEVVHMDSVSESEEHLHWQGQSVSHVATIRNCQESTVESYMAEAIIAGYGYFWPPPNYPTAAVGIIKTLAQQVLADAGKLSSIHTL